MSELYFQIGSLRLENPLVLAPLAGITNLPFRLLAKEHGAALVYTEMISAAGLSRQVVKTLKLADSSPTERPLAWQLFGHDPRTLAAAAQIAEEAGADVIDLNMGCPARRIVRHGAGAALLKDFKLIANILKSVRSVVHCPLTVKTRAGWRPGQGEVLDLAPILADTGVDAVTLHPRYAVDAFHGQADWDLVARLVERFPGPVIGNGDLIDPRQVVDRLTGTGCQGIMIGRGALGNPWIFRQTLDLLAGRPASSPDLAERLRTALKHARMMSDHFGPGRATFMLRSILMWYTKGLSGAAAFRQKINQIQEFDFLTQAISDYFRFLIDDLHLEEMMA